MKTNLITFVVMLCALYCKAQISVDKNLRYNNAIETAINNTIQKQPQAINQNRITTPHNKVQSFLPDADDDGMPDAWETQYGLDPNDATDAWADIDNDNVLNLFEYQLGSIANDPASPVTVDVNVGGNIATAIDNANAGELIRIEAGTYNLNYQGFTPKTVMIQGGWDNTFTSRNPYTTPSILNGKNTAEIFYFECSGDTVNVVVDGLQLINGGGFFGAVAFICDNGAVANLCMKDVTITQSKAKSAFTGCVTITHWKGSISDVRIANLLIANCRNSGIYNQTTYSSNAKWNVVNSTITNIIDTASADCYGIKGLSLDSTINTNIQINVKNAIIRDNSDAAIYFTNGGSSLGSSAAASYCDFDTVVFINGVVYTPGAGMINANPQFVNPTADYHLTALSPCIDAGINVGLPFVGAAPDMGIFEYGTVGIESVNHSSSLINIYPNPVANILFIDGDFEAENNSLLINDVSGHTVYQANTIHTTSILDVSKLVKGVYFVTIKNENGVSVMRIMKTD